MSVGGMVQHGAIRVPKLGGALAPASFGALVPYGWRHSLREYFAWTLPRRGRGEGGEGGGGRGEEGPLAEVDPRCNPVRGRKTTPSAPFPFPSTLFLSTLRDRAATP